MDISLDWLFADERMLPALAAVACAVATAFGLRVYQQAFGPRRTDEPNWNELIAISSAAVCCGLILAGEMQLATILGLTQSAIVCVTIIRDLRRIVEESLKTMRKQKAEAADLREELELYKTSFQEMVQRLSETEPAQERLANSGMVLENLMQGVAMFGADDRLVMCNRRFGEINRLPQDLMQPGTPYQQILTQRLRNGEFPGQGLESAESWRRGELSARRQVVVSATRDDGRTIETTMRLLPDGRSIAAYADVTDLRVAMSKAAQSALIDTLTGLPNRQQFMLHLDDALARMKRRGAPLAVMMLDIDHFKAVNDSLGLEQGDKLLQIVAERLRELMRETDIIARISGDRFALIADALTQAADATILAQRLVDVLGVPYLIDGHQVVTSASVGISIAPHDAEEAGPLMRDAEFALKRAKGDGRSTYRYFETGMDAHMRERRALEADLRSALARGEFELFFQPVANLLRDEIVGMEALIRWHHPVRGLVMPSDFIPFAEEVGLIQPIGRWVIREACACAASWPSRMRISVNVTSRELADPEFVATLRAALLNSGIAADRLELEITEGVLIDASPEVLSALAAARQMGVRISLDDFGTGYASLGNLQRFPFDKIKIERALLKGSPERSESFAMLRAVAALAAGLRIETTVEGVETEEQLANVRAHGCTEAQGFVISRPMPAQEVDEFLTSYRPTWAGDAVATRH